MTIDAAYERVTVTPDWRRISTAFLSIVGVGRSGH